MSNEPNQGSGQPDPAPTTPAPAPQPDFVDTFANQALIGTDKKSDTNPTFTTAVRPQGDTETR
ncbi:hypothetical protein ACG93S_11605 [Streptomyces sp. WAC01490]|uniref:hypothetical protein n=1 Tax=unclassified Streptomyces TaxID=2593676 RepID=UPI003F33E6B7